MANHFRPWRGRSLFRAVVAAAWSYWGIAPGLRAELTWKQRTIELQADAKATVIEARYRFTNDGPKPVDVRQVQTSCGCTTAALDRRHYESGQSGEIVARFTIGDRVGLQKKTILVATSDGPVPTALSLVVHIPELLRVQPAFVMWKQGEANAAKTIQIEAGQDGLSLKDVSVSSSNTLVRAELQPVVDGRKYQLSVTPDATDKPMFVTLLIRCRVGTEEKTFRAYASIPAPMPSQKPSAAGTANQSAINPALDKTTASVE